MTQKLFIAFLFVVALYLALCPLPPEEKRKEKTEQTSNWDTKKKRMLSTLQPLEGEALHYRLDAYAAELMAKNKYGNLMDFLKAVEDQWDNKPVPPSERRRLLYYQGASHYHLQEYDKAFGAYLRLKMLMSGSGDPLFDEVQGRIKELGESGRPVRLVLAKSLRSIDLRKYMHEPRYILLVTLFVLVLLPITFFFYSWNQKFDEEGSSMAALLALLSFRSPIERFCRELKEKVTKKKGWLEKDYEIINEKEPISMEEMRKADGRISKQALEQYCEKREFTEEGKYACVLCEGHEMILEVNRYVPYPMVLVNMMLKRLHVQKLNPFWAYTFFGFLLISLWIILSYVVYFELLNLTEPKPTILFLTAAVLIALLTGMRTMARKTIASLDEVVTMLENKASVDKVKRWIKSLFRSPWQIYVALILYSICIIIMIKSEGPILPMNVIFSGIIIFLASPLIWFIIRAIGITNQLAGMKDLSVNPLSPLKTLGLQKWISVIGTYALIASIILTVGSTIPVVSRYMEGKACGTGSYIWLFIFIPFLAIFWIYPYTKLKHLVRRIKIQRMHFFNNMISQSFNDWLEIEEELCNQRQEHTEKGKQLEEIISCRTEAFSRLEPQLKEMDKYYKLFKVIDESPESFLDIYAAFELAKVMGIPSLFAILSYYIGS